MSACYRKVDFKEVSSVYKCKCGKPIKHNMISKKLEIPAYCYKCWISKERSRGHLMRESSRGKGFRS